MEPSGILTLLTDFGWRDAYVAAMKGVILQRAPTIRIVDLSHEIPPQDIDRASFVLAEAAPWYPPGTVHVVVVDPGVGTHRHPLVARIGDQIVVAPDNGVIGQLSARTGGCRAWALEDPRLALPRLSHTFHGRDLFSPTGALLASGQISPEDCGPEITPLLPTAEAPRYEPGEIAGTIVTIDHFGNLISNIDGARLPDAGCPTRIALDDHPIPTRVQTYGAATPGSVVALVGSSGWFEVARVEGNAARHLEAGVGARLTVSWDPSGDD